MIQIEFCSTKNRKHLQPPHLKQVLLIAKILSLAELLSNVNWKDGNLNNLMLQEFNRFVKVWESGSRQRTFVFKNLNTHSNFFSFHMQIERCNGKNEANAIKTRESSIAIGYQPVDVSIESSMYSHEEFNFVHRFRNNKPMWNSLRK